MGVSTSGGRMVGIVRSQTQAMEFSFFYGCVHYICSHFVKQNLSQEANSPIRVRRVEFIPK
jgi:hypothetical protein